MYSSSTFFLAQGVLRKKVRLDLMLGSLIKQLMRMRRPSSSHPKWATRWLRMASSVLPCSGSFDTIANIYFLPGRFLGLPYLSIIFSLWLTRTFTFRFFADFW